MNNLKQYVFDSILDDILNGVYPVDFVFNEKYLIDKYQISRSPIRDALIELCNEKILRCIPRYGYEIVRISEKDIRDIAQFRLFIEVEALKLTCRPYQEQMVAGIAAFNRKTLEMLNDSEVSVRMMWQNNIDFHTMLLSFSNNEYAVDALKRALSTQYRAYSLLYRKKNSRAKHIESFSHAINEYHFSLESALRAGDFEASIKLLQDDICDISGFLKDE